MTEYTVGCGESLEGITIRKLGDESRAEEIKELNKSKINNPAYPLGSIYPFNPGTVIVIPVAVGE